MEYEKPEIVDFGDLLELTAGGQIGGDEDGGTKVIKVGVGGLISASIGILP